VKIYKKFCRHLAKKKWSESVNKLEYVFCVKSLNFQGVVMAVQNLLLQLTIVVMAVCSQADSLPPQQPSGFNRRTPIVMAYEKSHKAVVNISGKKLVTTSMWPGFNWPDVFGRDFFGPRYRAEVVVLGSGVVIHEDGYMVTNAHVVKGAEQLKAVFSDGSEHPAQVVSADDSKDLAVLKIQTNSKLPFIHLGRSNDLMIGEFVIAIGNPFGYSHTLTTGVISALGRDIPVAENFWLRGLIQTDAPINPGNSGGPLLNINGELVGITTAIRPEAQNIGFAIPVDTLADNLTQMLMPEKLRRVRLGLVIGRMTTAGKYHGLVVDSVIPESPAEKRGMAPGDLILEIDGKNLTSFIDFYVKMMSKEIGKPMVIEYIRPAEQAGRTRQAKLTIEPRPLPDGRKLAEKFFQMQVSELTESVARGFGYQGAYQILVLTDVAKGGQAARAGLQKGDLVLELNGAVVSNLKEFSLEMEKISEGNTVGMRILRIVNRGPMQYQRQFYVQLQARTMKKDFYKLL
jgi:serine protease Do